MYDALLDAYEPDEKTSRVRELFASLRDQLVKLLNEIVLGVELFVQIDLFARHQGARLDRPLELALEAADHRRASADHNRNRAVELSCEV